MGRVIGFICDFVCVCTYCKVKRKESIAVSNHFSPLREFACHMGSHSVICHPAEVTFSPLPQPIKAGAQFSNPGGMQG